MPSTGYCQETARKAFKGYALALYPEFPSTISGSTSLSFESLKWLVLAVPWGFLWSVIVVFPDHTHLLLFKT